MLNCKSVNPRWIFIILMLILSIIIFNNNIVKTYCEEEYQIAECPNNLYLDSYYLTAENSENAIKAVENILIENNLELNDYEIIIDKNIIKIIEKENKETEKTKKTETEIQETTEEKKTEETTTTQENNLEIENESVEFNNNEIIKRNIPILIPDIFNIKFNDEKIDYTLSLELSEGQQIKLLFTEIQNAIDNNYIDEKVTWQLKDESGKILTGEEKLYDDIEKGTGVHNYTVDIIKEKTEEGGTISNQDVKDFKEIGICICTLLAISILYNFTSALFRRI